MLLLTGILELRPLVDSPGFLHPLAVGQRAVAGRPAALLHGLPCPVGARCARVGGEQMHGGVHGWP